MANLWKCDDGTYDIVEEAGVTHMNVPECTLAAAPELLAALKGIMAEVAGCQKDEKYQAARAAIAAATGE